MSETTSTEPDSAARPNRRSTRRVAWIGGGLALVLVAAGLVVPQIVHAQRVSDYTALVAQRDDALHEKASAETRLQAASALRHAQETELSVLAQRLVAVGQAPEPILAAQTAQDLTAAGDAVAAAVGELDQPDEGAETLSTPLVTVVDAQRADDATARAEAEADGVEAPEPVAPASYLALTAAQAESLMDLTPTPEQPHTVADADVTDEVIEQAAAQVTTTRTETAELQAAIRAEESRMEELAAAIEAAVPVVRAAADAVPAQAVAVAEGAAKAPDAAGAATTAAHRVQEVGGADDLARTLDALTAYIEAAQAAQTAHAAEVERERIAAEAARKAPSARGGGGATPPRGSRLCSRYRPSPGGGGSLVLVYC